VLEEEHLTHYFLVRSELGVSLKGKPSVLQARASAHCFPLRIELVLERRLPAKYIFQSKGRLCSKYVYCDDGEKTYNDVFSKENHLCLKLQLVAHCFPKGMS
jgi:hypothetical protein